MDKKGNSTTVLIWVVAIAILLYLNSVGTFGTIFGAVKTTEETQLQQQIIKGASCPDPSNTMTIGPIKSKWNPTTSMSAINARVFKVSQKADGTYDTFKAGNDEGNKADAVTMTVGYPDKLGLIYAYDGAGAVNHYARWVEFEAPCAPFSTGSYDSGKNVVIQNASSGITFTIKNSDTGLVQDYAGAQNETIASGEYGYFDFTQVQTTEKQGISAGTDRVGNIGKVKVTVEMNGSMFDEESTTFGSLATTTTPSFYTVGNTDSKVKTFVTNGCPDPNQDSVKFCQENWGRLAVKAASGENPTGGSGGSDAGKIALGGIKVCLHDQDWFLHTKTGEPLFDFEDDLGTAKGKYGSAGFCVILDVT